MGKVRPTKVYTPGSRPPSATKSPGRGRPRKSRQPGTERKLNYRTKYTKEALDAAIKAVREKRLSLGEAVREFGVPKTTLHDRLHDRVSGTLGRPTCLSKEEELIIVERLLLMGEWGFPLTTMDLRLLIKTYLDSQGRVSRFPDNMPGKDFVYGFMHRNPTLTVRTANLIKRSRGALSKEQVDDFFDNFEQAAEGVPPENLWNYDETNLRNTTFLAKTLTNFLG